MFSGEREKLIMNYLMRYGKSSNVTLNKVTGASLATIRRDLDRLQIKGLVIRNHGGAELVSKQSKILVLGDYGYDPQLQDKESIANIAASLINDKDVIFLGAGKTCSLIARYIRDRKNITVVTCNIDAILELSTSKTIDIILLGGTVNIRNNFIETISGNELETLNKLYFDKSFITVNGIDLNYGYTIENMQQIQLYNRLMEISKKFFVIANSTKFNKRTFVQLCQLDKIKNVILNKNTDTKYISYYSDNNVNIYSD